MTNKIEIVDGAMPIRERGILLWRFGRESVAFQAMKGLLNLVAMLILWSAAGQPCGAEPGEEHLLLLRNGGRVVGIMPLVGGRIVEFRLEAGKNVLDGRPERWDGEPWKVPFGEGWKQCFGESVWPGPQVDWWTSREPYPIPAEMKNVSPGNWPPDPAWDTDPFEVREQSATRVVMKGPVSKLTGLELTKTVELLADGKLKFEVTATNRGDREVSRDLWLLRRVPLDANRFLPLKVEFANWRFSRMVTVEKIEGLTVLEPAPGAMNEQDVSGKMHGLPAEGWMAAATAEAFLIIEFPMVSEAHMAPEHSPVEVYCATPPVPLCEMEHHGELRTLKPGETMRCEETWRIIPNTKYPDAVSQAHFLRTEIFPVAAGK